MIPFTEDKNILFIGYDWFCQYNILSMKKNCCCMINIVVDITENHTDNYRKKTLRVLNRLPEDIFIACFCCFLIMIIMYFLLSRVVILASVIMQLPKLVL